MFRFLLIIVQLIKRYIFRTENTILAAICYINIACDFIEYFRRILENNGIIINDLKLIISMSENI